MLEILKVSPPLPSQRDFIMLESFTVTLVLKYPFSIKELRPQVWTNVVHKKNPEGKWHSMDMNLLKTESDGKTHHFRVTCIVTGQGTYEFTTRVGLRLLDDEPDDVGKGKSEDDEFVETTKEDFEDVDSNDDDIVTWKWAGGFGDNGRIIVHPPNDKMAWTKGPQAVQVCSNVYIGNFSAASHAVEMGFDAVLNMALELDDFYEGNNITYKKLGLPDGAHNSIPPDVIREAIRWIEERTLLGQKVLVHCRAGLGRSGSIGIAYLYHKNGHWNFKETLKAVWKVKPDVYPHKELDITLEKLFTRFDSTADVDLAVAPELRKSEAQVLTL